MAGLCSDTMYHLFYPAQGTFNTGYISCQFYRPQGWRYQCCLILYKGPRVQKAQECQRQTVFLCLHGLNLPLPQTRNIFTKHIHKQWAISSIDNDNVCYGEDSPRTLSQGYRIVRALVSVLFSISSNTTLALSEKVTRPCQLDIWVIIIPACTQVFVVVLPPAELTWANQRGAICSREINIIPCG